MSTLAQTLGQTAPMSPLVRKARRLGIQGCGDAIELAAHRGCRHYATKTSGDFQTPGQEEFSDEELTIFLLVGEHRYEPMAIRCAAQLARSPRVDPTRLARLARQHRTERVLAYVARAGLVHDMPGRIFWKTVLAELPASLPQVEADLPHWSRFVSMPGRQRHEEVPPQWLTPSGKY